MSKASSASLEERDTMRAEYDFSGAVRGVTARRYARGRNTVAVMAGDRSPDGDCAADYQWGQAVYEFVQGVADAPQSPTLFNPWYDTDGHDRCAEAPEQRRLQLLAYLLARRDASLVFIAEAMGYQGGRFSGIAMTSERMLLDSHADVRPDQILPAEFPIGRTSKSDGLRSRAARRHGLTEPTATVVWRALCRSFDPFKFVLWNSVPWHPPQAGERAFEPGAQLGGAGCRVVARREAPRPLPRRKGGCDRQQGTDESCESCRHAQFAPPSERGQFGVQPRR